MTLLLSPLEYEAFHEILPPDAQVIIVKGEETPKADFALPIISVVLKGVVN